MAKVVEISNHFLDEETGICGYVANNNVYLKLVDDEGVTREQFRKKAIKYVGMNISAQRIGEYMDIYDEAEIKFLGGCANIVEDGEDVKQTNSRADVSLESSDSGNDVGIQISIENNTEDNSKEVEIVDSVKVIVKPIIEDSSDDVDDSPNKQSRAVGRRGSARKAKVKDSIRSKK